eukprot:scaffold585_cov237-Pinguiococcus_pyrenoidosus.AAC.8
MERNSSAAVTSHYSIAGTAAGTDWTEHDFYHYFNKITKKSYNPSWGCNPFHIGQKHFLPTSHGLANIASSSTNHVSQFMLNRPITAFELKSEIREMPLRR